MPQPKTKSEKRYVGPRTIAEWIGSSIETVHGFIKNGELKATNVARGSRPRWRVKTADCELFMDARSNQSTTAVQLNDDTPELV